jgi:hypothetical protein
VAVIEGFANVFRNLDFSPLAGILLAVVRPSCASPSMS